MLPPKEEATPANESSARPEEEPNPAVSASAKPKGSADGEEVRYDRPGAASKACCCQEAPCNAKFSSILHMLPIADCDPTSQPSMRYWPNRAGAACRRIRAQSPSQRCGSRSCS